MIGNLLDLPLIDLCEHLLLIFLLSRELRRRLAPKIVAWAQCDFPEIERFFQVMRPDLARLYSLVDQAKAATGHPPLCHHFQLRFLIFYFLAGFETFVDALDYVNSSPKWAQILGKPVERYYGSTLSRFLERVGEETFQAIEGQLVRLMLKHRLITLKHLLIDGFPIISHLNTQKCLKRFKFDGKLFENFFQHLDLSLMEEFFASWRYVKYKPVMHFKLFIFQHLWGYSSISHMFGLFKKRPKIPFVLVGSDRLASYESYRRFAKKLVAHPDWNQVKFFLETQILHNPFCQPFIGDWGYWQGLMDNSLQLRDPGARLNYCSSKDLTYQGREGGLFVDGDTELPLIGWVQSGARIGTEEFHNAMELASELLPSYRKIQTVVGDKEFDTDRNEASCKEFLGAQLVRSEDPGDGRKRRLPDVFFLLRLGVERAISRLAKLNKMQRPPVLKNHRVKSYVHTGIISLQLLAIYSAKTGQKNKCRSLKWIRQKQAV